MARIAIVLNKERSELNFSETFIQAHVDRLPCDTTLLIGIPGRRRLMSGRRPFVPSRAAVPLGTRWLSRRLGLSTVAAQDRRAMAAFLTRRRIDAVLAEYGPTAVTVMDACRDAGVPLIAHFHGYDAYCHYFTEHFADRYRALFDTAQAVVAVSTHMRAQLIALGADPARTFYNSCGADLPDGPPADPAAQPPRFLMVGRLVEKKSPQTSLRAFAGIGDSSAALDVVGEGPLLDACRQSAVELGIADRVTFHGARSHEEVLDFMRRSRCFIQHSVRAPDGDHEGTPVSVLEAMGMGLPVVATRHGGITDVISKPDLGTLVDENDTNGMAAAMSRFAAEPEHAARIGHNARNEVILNWTAGKSVARLWRIVASSMSHQATAN